MKRTNYRPNLWQALWNELYGSGEQPAGLNPTKYAVHVAEQIPILADGISFLLSR